MDLKSGMTLFMPENLKIILYLHFAQQRTFGRIFGTHLATTDSFARIVRSNVRPISTVWLAIYWAWQWGQLCYQDQLFINHCITIPAATRKPS